MNYKSFIDFLKKTNPPVEVMLRLNALKMLKERPDLHPESSVFLHTGIVVERLLPTNDPDLIIAGLLHDIFKHDTAKLNPKTGYVCIYHDVLVAGFIQSNRELREWIINQGANLETVRLLCRDHMRYIQVPKMKESKLLEFKQRPHWNKLCILGEADDMTKEFNLKELAENQ